MPRLLSTTLEFVYDEVVEESLYKKEFDRLSQSDEDPVGQWVKLAKAKGDTSESDQVMLTLLVELHRKVDALTAIVKNEETHYLELLHVGVVDGVGFEHFSVEDGVLEIGKRYYGRILMPLFPKREVPLFFEAVEPNLAKIEMMHDSDMSDWNAYVVARERLMIRQMKADKDGK